MLVDNSSNYLNIGSQKWIDGELDYLYYFDNRYKINEVALNSLSKVNSLFLDGVPISIDSDENKFLFHSEYLLLRQNDIQTSLNNFQFTENLRYISLDENNFNGDLPSYFFTYPILENLSNAKALKNLTLNNNNLIGSVPESICDLTELKVLHLQYNNLSEIPDCICEMRKRGVEIELYGNKFCEDIPKCAENIIGFQDCY